MSNDSRTSLKRLDHHVSPMSPRLLRARIRRPATAAKGGWYHDLLVQRADAARVERRRLGDPPGATSASASRVIASADSATRSRSCAVESSVSQPSPVPTIRSARSRLALDHPVDALLERADADELADLDVASLADAERPVGGLVLDGGVPPAIEGDNVAHLRYQ